MGRREGIGRDDDLGCELVRGIGHGVERSGLEARADHGDEAREVLGRGVVDDEHIAAELGERIDDREADGVEAQDEHSEARPVGVPAREAVEARRRVAAHISESHSM